MNIPYINISTKTIVHWFNAIRNLPDAQRTRALDAFWSGQIDSKAWLVRELNKVVNSKSNICIFGGWIGVLGSMLFESSTFEINSIRSIDLDPWCESIADTVCQPQHEDNWRFKAITSDMKDYHYDWDISPDIIINTSSEHVDQSTYDNWYDRVPSGALLVVQGNNFFDCDEHVRCSSSLLEFKRMNHVNESFFAGELPHDLYTRYMCVWRK